MINLVKFKLEEYSPFDEPKELVALPANNVKPIDSYIEKELIASYNDVLLTAPLYMLTELADLAPLSNIAFKNWVCYLPVPIDFLRLRTVCFDNWNRDVKELITPSHSLYALQRNVYTRGRTEKPFIAINNDMFEIYCATGECTEFSYVVRQHANCNNFNDHLADLIATRCAITILQIFEQNSIAAQLLQDYNVKLENLKI